MNSRDFILIRILFITFVCLVIITLIGLVLFILQLPLIAAYQFGEPIYDLNRYQQIYYSSRLLLNEDLLVVPVNLNGQTIEFEIAIGEPVHSMVYRLEEAGLIYDSGLFQFYLVYKGMDTSIQAGKYILSPSMNAIEIAEQLQDATPEYVNLGVLAGWRVEEIAASLPTSGVTISPEEFLNAINNPDREKYENEAEKLLLLIPEDSSLEGYMFPGTYTVPREIGVEELISMILGEFYVHVVPELNQRFIEQGLNMNDAVILASITQREAVIQEEQPLISSVLLNRLKAGMRLETDPTVQYALGYNNKQSSWWTNPLNAIDLRVTSPYNTYRNSGLPPGPICSPGINALKSIAYAIESPYYYFRAACDGSGLHNFAVTFEEHINNACD